MKQFFINAAILTVPTAIALTVFSFPTQLSALNEFTVRKDVSFRKATVTEVNFNTGTVLVELDEAQGFEVPLTMSATTTIYLPDGNETLLPSLRVGASVYVFGSYDDATQSLYTDKVVIRNKRITERTGLSRAQLERPAAARTVPERSLTSLILLKSK